MDASSTGPEMARIIEVMDTTWPAAEYARRDGWTLRRGAGGGNRVSAASGTGAVADVVAGLAAWGQGPLFRLTSADAALDAELAALGYETYEPTVLYAASAAEMIGTQSHIAAAYQCQFRPAVMEEIWTAGGIGPARWAIMDRVALPKTFLMSRADDTPCAVGFVAIDGDTAMVHALEVLSAYRRKGCARLIMEAAARLAVEQGARWLTLAVTEANVAGNALYGGLGMAKVGGYHYRRLAGDAVGAAAQG